MQSHGLLLHVIIKLVPSGHDAHIVSGTDIHIIADMFHIPHHGPLCPQKHLGIGKRLPVIHNHAAESHMGQNRNQLLGHMTASEYIDSPGLYQGLDIKRSSIHFLLESIAAEKFPL